MVEYPSSNDVLLGRGRPFQVWNCHLSELIKMHRERYEGAPSRFEKTCISIDIVKTVKSTGGRFLQRSQDEGGWVEVSDDVAREKVSCGFRTAMKMARSK